MARLDTAKLTRTIRDGSHEFVYVRPGIIAAYYLDEPVRQLGPKLAGAFERYLAFTGRDALKASLADDGTFKPLTDRRLQRDLKLLRDPPRNAQLGWIYSSADDGGIGEFGIRLFASDPDQHYRARTTLLRLEFPDDAVDRYGIDKFLEFVAGEAHALGAQSGNAGWGFKRADAFASDARKAVNALLPRYLAFDPCFDLACLTMRGHSPWAHWVNFFSRELFEKCGGSKRLRAEAADAELTWVKDVAAVRSSRLPPIGDSNRGAKDIGSMPAVQRFLTPVLVRLTGLGDSQFDVGSWLGRFEGRSPEPWVN